MKTNFLIIFLIINQIVFAQKKQIDSNPKILYTHWCVSISKNCQNHVYFNENNNYQYNSCEQEERYPGVYSVKGDTIFISEFSSNEDDSFSIFNIETRIVAILTSKNKLQFLSRENLIRNASGELKWAKTELTDVYFVPYVSTPKFRYKNNLK